jgi:chromosome segregation ATPase
MTKTIAEKAVEMAEANTALNAQATEQAAQLLTLTAQVTDLTAKVSAFESDKTSLTEKIKALTSERDALAAQIATLSATLALTPQAKLADGVEPIKDTPAPEVSEAAKVTTWQQALADCGGDYVKARSKHVKIFDAYIEAHKNDTK